MHSSCLISSVSLKKNLANFCWNISFSLCHHFLNKTKIPWCVKQRYHEAYIIYLLFSIFPPFPSFDYLGPFNSLTFQFVNHCFALSNLLLSQFIKFLSSDILFLQNQKYIFVLFVQIQDSSEIISFNVLNILIILILDLSVSIALFYSSFYLVLFLVMSINFVLNVNNFIQKMIRL